MSLMGNRSTGHVRGIPVAIVRTLGPNVIVEVDGGLGASPLEATNLGDPRREATTDTILTAVERLVASAEAAHEAACADARIRATPFDRRDGVRRLGAMRTKTDRVTRQLEASLLDPDFRVRLAAAIALGRGGTAFLPADEPWLLDLVGGFDAGSRIEASQVLAVIGSRDAIPRLAAARAEGGPAAEALSRAIGAIGLREHIEHGGLELADGAREVGQVSVSPPKGALSEKD